MGNDNPYANNRLWVASYRDEPYMPIGWSEWFMHQYTSSGRLPGYAGNLDMNRISDENFKLLIQDDTPVTILPLEVPLLSQKDSRWASETLGTSAVTIGGYGCLITSVAMTCNYFGKDTDPARLNDALIEVNGYESGNLLRFASVTTIYPDILVDWTAFLSNPEDEDIDWWLEVGVPVIVQVDYKPDTAVLEQHWVVIIGKDEHGYLIADPIDGQVAYLSRYGKAYRMVVYTYQPISEPLFKARVICTALNVRKGPSTAFEIVDLLLKDEVVNVYEEQDNWFRIGEGRWCSGYPAYMERIEIAPPPPVLTLEERVARLEKEVFGES
jgi:uncharacterized protein YvpB